MNSTQNVDLAILRLIDLVDTGGLTPESLARALTNRHDRLHSLQTRINSLLAREDAGLVEISDLRVLMQAGTRVGASREIASLHRRLEGLSDAAAAQGYCERGGEFVNEQGARSDYYTRKNHELHAELIRREEAHAVVSGTRIRTKQDWQRHFGKGFKRAAAALRGKLLLIRDVSDAAMDLVGSGELPESIPPTPRAASMPPTTVAPSLVLAIHVDASSVVSSAIVNGHPTVVDRQPRLLEGRLLDQVRRSAACAAEQLGQTLTDVVMTVPASRTQQEVAELRRLSEACGLNLIRALPASEAAAIGDLWLRDQRAKDQDFVILDWSDAAPNVTVLSWGDGVLFSKSIRSRQIDHEGGHDHQGSTGLTEKGVARGLTSMVDLALADSDLGDGAPRVLLIGTAASNEGLRDELEEQLHRPVLGPRDSGNLIALGAALHAGLLGGQSEEAAVISCTPWTVRLTLIGHSDGVTVPRDSSYPINVCTDVTLDLRTAEPARMLLVEGAEGEGLDSVTIAALLLGGVSRRSGESSRVRLNVDVDVNGGIHVGAQDLLTGRSMPVFRDPPQYLV